MWEARLMWHYSGLRPLALPNAQLPAAGYQSTIDLLLSLRGAVVGLQLTTTETTPESLLGTLDEVTARSLILGLVVPAPEISNGAHLLVEIQDGQLLLRFVTRLVRPVDRGATRLETALPHQVESVQRRQFSRQRLSSNILYALDNSSSSKHQKTGLGQAMDLSPGGLRMVAQHPLPVGQRLFLSFTLPDGASFRGLTAQVIRCHMEGTRPIVALQFEALAPPVDEELFQALTRQTYKSPMQR
jgi:hypothetical protein